MALFQVVIGSGKNCFLVDHAYFYHRWEENRVGRHSCLSPIVSLRIGLDCEAVTTVKATDIPVTFLNLPQSVIFILLLHKLSTREF